MINLTNRRSDGYLLKSLSINLCTKKLKLEITHEPDKATRNKKLKLSKKIKDKINKTKIITFVS